MKFSIAIVLLAVSFVAAQTTVPQQQQQQSERDVVASGLAMDAPGSYNS